MPAVPVSSASVVFVAVFMDFFVSAMLLPILPVYIKDLGFTAIEVGQIVSVFSIMQMLGNICLGKISDITGRKPVLCGAIFSVAASLVMFAMVESFPLILLSRAITGFFAGTLGIAQAYITDITTPEERPVYLGAFGGMVGLGMTIGPAAGSLSMHLGGIKALVAISCIIAFFELLAAFLFMENYRPPHEETLVEADKSPVESAQKQSLCKLLMGPIFAVYCVVFLHFFGIGIQNATQSLYFKHYYSLDLDAQGALFSILGLTMVVSQTFIFPRLMRLLGPRMVVCYGLSIRGGCLFLVSLVFWQYTPQAFTFLFGLSTVLNPVSMVLCGMLSPPSLRGSVMGLNQATGAFGRFVGPFLSGYLYKIQPAYPYLLSASMSLCGIVLAACFPSSGPKPSAPDMKKPLKKGASLQRRKSYLETAACGYDLPSSVAEHQEEASKEGKKLMRRMSGFQV